MVMYLLCIQEEYRVVALRWIGIDLAIAGETLLSLLHSNDDDEKRSTIDEAFF
jgi:hypothetical protein